MYLFFINDLLPRAQSGNANNAVMLSCFWRFETRSLKKLNHFDKDFGSGIYIEWQNNQKNISDGESGNLFCKCVSMIVYARVLIFMHVFCMHIFISYLAISTQRFSCDIPKWMNGNIADHTHLEKYLNDLK